MLPEESAGIRRCWDSWRERKEPGIRGVDGIQLWLRVGKRTAWNSQQEPSHIGTSTGLGGTPGSFGFSVAGPSQPEDPELSLPDPSGTQPHPHASHSVSHSSRTSSFSLSELPEDDSFSAMPGKLKKRIYQECGSKMGNVRNAGQKWELLGMRLVLQIFSHAQLIPLEPWIYGILGAHQHSQNQEGVFKAAVDPISIPEYPGFPGGS